MIRNEGDSHDGECKVTAPTIKSFAERIAALEDQLAAAKQARLNLIQITIKGMIDEMGLNEEDVRLVLGIPLELPKVSKKVAIKYRNPDRPHEAWAGRGREPLWIKQFRKTHGGLNEALVDKPPLPERVPSKKDPFAKKAISVDKITAQIIQYLQKQGPSTHVNIMKNALRYKVRSGIVSDILSDLFMEGKVQNGEPVDDDHPTIMLRPQKETAPSVEPAQQSYPWNNEPEPEM
jgi:DNA-binding protein H-NS